MEFCARIPNDLKVHGSTTKHILNSQRELVPDRTIEEEDPGSRPLGRGAGGGRGIPLSAQENPALAEFLRVDAVRALVDEQARTAGYAVSQSLLRILILEVAVPRARRSS